MEGLESLIARVRTRLQNAGGTNVSVPKEELDLLIIAATRRSPSTNLRLRYRVQDYLAECADPVTPGAVGQALGCDPAQAGRVLAGLVRDGMARRVEGMVNAYARLRPSEETGRVVDESGSGRS
jgi:hypothetical protein